MDLINDIISFEQGELNEEQIIELFQKLIDNGMAWTLQDSYGRAASYFIEHGICHV